MILSEKVMKAPSETSGGAFSLGYRARFFAKQRYFLISYCGVIDNGNPSFMETGAGAELLRKSLMF
jgi:hypothetical protein